jgi:hypothetical protein
MLPITTNYYQLLPIHQYSKVTAVIDSKDILEGAKFYLRKICSSILKLTCNLTALNATKYSITFNFD